MYGMQQPTQAPQTVYDRINVDVKRLITPIMSRMTAVMIEESQRPELGQVNGQDKYRLQKLECVHIVFNGNNPDCKLYQTPEGELKCSVCGRKIYAKFDGSNVDILLNARQCIEQVMWFGMINNMKPDLLNGCIEMKKSLPALIQVASELNDFVRRKQNDSDTVSNIGAEYRFPNITSGF